MDQSSLNQNRKSRRSNVLLTATLEVDGAPLAVKLRNLSEQGALVEGDPLPAPETAVLFRRNDLSVRGRIAWVNGKQAGVAFDHELPAELVLRHVPPARQRIQPKFRRPGLVRHELSPEEQRMIDSCVWYQAPTTPED